MKYHSLLGIIVMDKFRQIIFLKNNIFLSCPIFFFLPFGDSNASDQRWSTTATAILCQLLINYHLS